MVLPLLILMLICALFFTRDHIISREIAKKDTHNTLTAKSGSPHDTKTTQNKNYFISPSILLNKLKNKEHPTIIDIRSRSSFKKYRIPGSINIRIYALKTKTYLKSKEIILVDEGYNRHRLVDACTKLRHLGFNVSILEGGLNLWKKKGGKLVGDAFAMANLDEIPPRSFVAERNSGKWVLIDVSEADSSVSHDIIGQTINIPFRKDSDDFVSNLRKVIEKYSRSAETRILVFDDNGKTYRTIRKHLSALNTDNVYFLKGGFSDYRSFLNAHRAMLNPGKKEIFVEPGCSTCQ